VPVFLITVFSKGERSDLSQVVVSEYRKKVVKIERRTI
jgi:hypothetical protein